MSGRRVGLSARDRARRLTVAPIRYQESRYLNAVSPGSAGRASSTGRILYELTGRRVRCPDGTVGSRRTHPRQVIVLRDRSGSTSWSDPHGMTAGAARAVARYLSDWSRGGQPDHFAAAQFDHECDFTLPFMPAPKARRLVKPFWPTPRGGTDIPLALHGAADAASAYDLHPTVVILITDGVGGTSQELAAALARFDPGAVHLVVVDQGGGWWPHAAGVWNGLPLGSVSVIDGDPLDPVVCTHTIGEAAAAAIGAGGFHTKGKSVFNNNPTELSIHQHTQTKGTNP